MANNSRSQSQDNYFLQEEQLRELLDMLNVIISYDTHKVLVCYCPFHANRDTPAFNISKYPGHLWKCHNGKCNKSGNIVGLLILKGYTRNEAEKMITRGAYEHSDLSLLVERLMADPTENEEWRAVDVTEFQSDDQASGYPTREYMLGRGICAGAYDFFRMGYSKAKDMAVIPVFDERAALSGVIGREIKTKRYQYSTGLRRSELIWNLHSIQER